MSLKNAKSVIFPCRGFNLYGTLHLPDSPGQQPETGVVMINAGPTDRSGPHRLYVKIANFFAKQEVPVLRFDPRGVGESNGYWENIADSEAITTVFKKIMEGVWVDDTYAAINFLCQKTGVESVILYGHCGGAITAMIVGAKDAKVSNICCTGLPVTYSATNLEVSKLPTEIINRDFRLYIKNIVSPRSLFRFLTFKSDYKTLIAVLMTRFRSFFKSKVKKADDHIEKLNPHFINAYKITEELNKEMLFVYGENDYLLQEFKQFFLQSQLVKRKKSFLLEVIPMSNHNMTEQHSQDQLFNILNRWLMQIRKSPALITTTGKSVPAN